MMDLGESDGWPWNRRRLCPVKTLASSEDHDVSPNGSQPAFMALAAVEAKLADESEAGDFDRAELPRFRADGSIPPLHFVYRRAALAGLVAHGGESCAVSLSAASCCGSDGPACCGQRPQGWPRCLPCGLNLAPDEGAPKTGRQIRLDVKIGELSVTEMRRLGIDFSEIRNGQKQQDHEETAGFVAMLTRNNVFKIVAEPSLIAAEGRPAFFHSGPTVAGRKIGSQVQLTAKLLDNHRVKIELHATQTDEEPLLAVALRGGIAPAFRTSEMVKSFEMDLGKTMITGGTVQTQPATDAPHAAAFQWAGPDADALFRHAAVGRAGGVIDAIIVRPRSSRSGTCIS